jgi:hypothetical protein
MIGEEVRIWSKLSCGGIYEGISLAMFEETKENHDTSLYINDNSPDSNMVKVKLSLCFFN